MKKFFVVAMVTVVLDIMAMFAGNRTLDNESQTDEDSTVAVVAWFSKSDTLVYWVGEGEWNVVGNDTIKTLGLWTKVMLTVTDSTKNGFDLEYRFLEFDTDPSVKSEQATLIKAMMDKFAPKMTETPIRLHTDELGHIEKYYNLKEIKKLVKEMYGVSYKEIMRQSGLKDLGLDIKKIDTDELVQSYVEDVDLMFCYHGNEFKMGNSNSHSDATENEYASDTYCRTERDEETMDYSVAVAMDTYVPAKDIAAYMVEFVKSTTNELPEDFDQELTEYVKEPVVFNSYVDAEYFSDGWPKTIVLQEGRVIVNRGKLKQTKISCDARNFN